MNTGFLGPAVATVPTVYGIETLIPILSLKKSNKSLQQYLPFTVLKLNVFNMWSLAILLQQYLPFTVLKPSPNTLL